ncbi:uncharacterized protein LOC113794314 [Dermatophagoides pteronyssinus]|uniref:uncharacterized protein LOC113794314 n=1 Tax=Dermatophagoides pteronyssinus TaxID=6956 RepID=UPI003F67F9E7
MDDLEIIKENVQPLRQGRKIEELKAAFGSDIVETNNRREMIRQKFQNDIDQCKNDDDKLFELYYKYIDWIEQNYPHGSKEIKFKEILENCLEKFYKNEKYQNDERMLSIFLRHINLISNPIDVFKFFYKKNFAKKLSRFYKEWSYQFEMQNKFKQAMKVIKLGIDNGAEPISALTRTLNDLEVRTMRFVTTTATDEEQTNERKALNKLKPLKDSSGKIVKAPITRTCTLKNNDGIRKISNIDPKSNQQQQQNVEPKFEIFTENEIDDDDQPPLPPPQSDDLKISNQQISVKENEIKTDQWKGNRLDLKKKKLPLSANKQEKFEIFCDSNNVAVSSSSSSDNNVDKQQQQNNDDQKYPVVIMDNKEKLKGWILYDRIDEIYRNGTEYSLEELKYKKWLANQEEKLLKEKEKLAEKDANEKVVATAAAVNEIEKQNQPESEEKTTLFFYNQQQKQRLNLNKPTFFNENTGHLSPIVELSREEYSKSSSSSSSSSSATISYVGTKKVLIFINNNNNLDPFDLKNRQKILSKISDPIDFRTGYHKISGQKLPKIFIGQIFQNFNQKFILLPYDNHNDDDHDNNDEEFYLYARPILDDQNQSDFSINSMKLSRKIDYYWEFYIYDELRKRLKQNKYGTDIDLSILLIEQMIFFQNGYLTFYKDFDWNFSIRNLIRKNQERFPDLIIAIVALELILIIKKLHDCEIIHSNISIDNVILSSINEDDIDALPIQTSLIKLINFSQSIDMKILPDDIQFDIQTIENKQQQQYRLYWDILQPKSWNYQIDWIGFLNCIHWMVFGTDLKIQRQNQNIIVLEQSFDSNISLILEPIFKQLLNLNANQKPDLDDHIMKLIDFIKSNIDKDAISLFNSFFLTNELNRL